MIIEIDSTLKSIIQLHLRVEIKISMTAIIRRQTMMFDIDSSIVDDESMSLVRLQEEQSRMNDQD